MAKGATFPADDVPDRTEAVLAVLKGHAPVRVPVTALYLSIPDKRALAETFKKMETAGLIEQSTIAPGDEDYVAAAELAGLDATARVAIGAFRLPK